VPFHRRKILTAKTVILIGCENSSCFKALYSSPSKFIVSQTDKLGVWLIYLKNAKY